MTQSDRGRVLTGLGTHSVQIYPNSRSSSLGKGPGACLAVLVAAVAIALVLTGLSLPRHAVASTEPAATDDALYAKGKSSFRKRCARCHGVNMVNPGAGIYDLRNFPRDEQARFVESVTYGRNAMPSWQDVLTPEDIEALWVYVSGASADPPP